MRKTMIAVAAAVAIGGATLTATGAMAFGHSSGVHASGAGVHAGAGAGQWAGRGAGNWGGGQRGRHFAGGFGPAFGGLYLYGGAPNYCYNNWPYAYNYGSCNYDYGW